MQMGRWFAHLERLFSNDVVRLGLLAPCLIITRLPFCSQYLYEWDSVHYALAIEKFDIIWHQPHPPGYLFFVLLAKAFHAIFGEHNTSLIALGLVLSLLTLLFLYLLARGMFNQRVATIASLILILNPLFWFYGCIATIYAAEAFAATSVGLLCWLALSRGKQNLYLGALWLGLMGGIRQTLEILLFPLWLLSTLSKDRKISRIVLALVCLGTGTIAWYVPTILSTGGWSNYNATSGAMSVGSMEKLQTFFGGFAEYYSSNLSNMAVWCLQGLTPLGIILLLWAAVELGKNLKGTLKDTRAQFYGLWALVPFVFYLLGFLDKPGYLLTFLPSLWIAIGWMFDKLSAGKFNGKRRRIALTLFTANCILCAVWFSLPVKIDGIWREIRRPASLPKPPLSDYVWDLSYRDIIIADARIEGLLQALNSPDFGPEKTVLCFKGGQPNWRQLAYYFPNHPTYWLIDVESSGLPQFGAETYLSYQGTVTSTSNLPFWLPGSRPETLTILLPATTERIVWFVPRNSDFLAALDQEGYISGEIELKNIGQSYFYTAIPKSGALQIGVFTFLREHP